MRKIFLFSLLFASQYLHVQNNTTVTQLDSVLTILNKEHQFNGAVLHAEKGKVLYKKAFGIAGIQTYAPLQTNSSFNLASMSKQFITMCIMISRNEVIELAKTATEYHGRYISHIRSEDVDLADAIDEIINIGRVTKLPVRICHFY